MSGTLINLVKLNTLDETTEHDYTGGEIRNRHDEIKLEDPNGCPCAIPLPTTLKNLDHRYNYITGSIGIQSSIIKRNLNLSIDYIGNDVSRKLEQWMHQRAYVVAAPNMGRDTVFSYRPVRTKGTDYIDGNTALDITGNYEMEHSQSTSTLLTWDEQKMLFVKKSVDDVVPLFDTPGGAAVGSPRTHRNLMKPAYPEGAGSATGAGNSGWVKAGSDLSQLTFSIASGGFGHPDCPDSLKVAYTDDVTAVRSIEVKGLFDPGSGDYGGFDPSGSGELTFCIWIKGQLPDRAKLWLFGISSSAVDLSGKRFNGWTPLMISLYEPSWSAATPYLFFDLASANGVGGSFEIGPTYCQQSSGYGVNAGGYWMPDTVWTGSNDIKTVSGFSFPGQGTAIVSFFLPDWWNDDGIDGMHHSLIGSGTVSIDIHRLHSGERYVSVRDSISGGLYSVLVTDGFSAGEINTVAFTWNGKEQNVYVNGKLAGSVNMSSEKIDFGSSSSQLKIGDGSSGYAMYPALLLSARVDEGAMAAEEVNHVHVALTDPIAIQFAMLQRGRVFQITSVPQTIRSGAGGSQVIGQLKLEQVDFQHWNADPLNVEEVVR